ncbi:MAG: UDP-N-acetylmuramoyl-tripeptide--D-alanyl-D-alanine ligase, partial [bacterium]
KEAFDRGAVLAVVDNGFEASADRVPPLALIVVGDTIKALQSLAAYWRSRYDIPLVAVVGSVGKTTTKEMAAQVISTMGPCLKNEGNLNNHIGLPLSLMDLSDYHRYAVLELGANIPGEIGLLSSIARPDAAVITRLGWAHLEGFGDPESLVHEKGAVLDELPPSGWCALNFDDPRSDELKNRANCDVIGYGFDSGEVRASEISLGKGTSFVLETPSGSGRVRLNTFGRHFIENALAAVAVALPFEIPIEKIVSSLSAWDSLEQRGRIIEPEPGVFFIDDTYNANPLSMETALSSLSALRSKGVTVAVLGEMKELGKFSDEGHTYVGGTAGRLGIDYLVVVGESAGLMAKGALSAGMEAEKIMECQNENDAVKALSGLLAPGAWVLFKGSRAARMERIIEYFTGDQIPAEAGGS